MKASVFKKQKGCSSGPLDCKYLMNMMTTTAVEIDAMQTMGTNGEDSLLRSVRAELVDAVSSVVVTAEEFRERVQNEAIQLSSCGVRAGSIVLLEARSDVRFLSRLMALFELKAVAVPFDSKITETEKQRQLSTVRPSHCYLSEADAPDAVLSISKEVSALPKDACLLLLTSGTTGLPKAVIHGFSNLQARIANGRQAISLEQRRSCLSVLPLYFGHGLIGVVLQALLDSERLVLVPPELGEPTLASQIGKWIDAYDVTFVSGTPGTWSYITRMSPPPGKRSLRRVQMASAHATPELQQKSAPGRKRLFSTVTERPRPHPGYQIGFMRKALSRIMLGQEKTGIRLSKF
jgi:acyl-CoA synthetase (AMP-forming)/AMP-acid ligase II